MIVRDLINSFVEKFSSNSDIKLVIDDVNVGLAYIGVAPAGTATSTASWRIHRLLEQGDVSTIEIASTGMADQIWDNRASLFGVPAFTNINSIQFDGVNDYLAAPHSADLNFERTQTFSFGGWVKFDSVSVQQYIIAKRQNFGDFRGWLMDYLNGTGVRILLHNESNTNRITVTGPTLLTGTWYHLIATYSGNSLASGIRLYINSINTALTVAFNNLTSTIQTTVTTQLGGRGDAVFLDGNLDEMAVWNIELNQSQINEIYNTGVPIDLSQLSTGANLVSWWRMGDGGTFPTILDNKGTNHMTMTNMSNSGIVTDVP